MGDSYSLFYAAGTTTSVGQNEMNIVGVTEDTDNVIKVQAVGNDIKLYVNGAEKSTLSNQNRPFVSSLDVYASGNFHFPAAKATIKDLTFAHVSSPITITFPPIITIANDNKVGTITYPSNEFILSFKLNPTEPVAGWSSIIRLTSTSGEMDNYGDRWVTFFFNANTYNLHFVAGTTTSPDQHQTNIAGVQLDKDNDI